MNIILKKTDIFCSCVYLLKKDDVVVYVGQTKQGVKRISQHYDKDFDSVEIMPCSEELLNQKESYYILRHSPKYNTQPTNCRTIDGIKSYMAKKHKKRIYKKDIILFIESNNIEVISFKGKACVSLADFDVIVSHFYCNFNFYIN